jgi:hypothetical protein
VVGATHKRLQHIRENKTLIQLHRTTEHARSMGLLLLLLRCSLSSSSSSSQLGVGGGGLLMSTLLQGGHLARGSSLWAIMICPGPGLVARFSLRHCMLMQMRMGDSPTQDGRFFLRKEISQVEAKPPQTHTHSHTYTHYLSFYQAQAQLELQKGWIVILAMDSSFTAKMHR